MRKLNLLIGLVLVLALGLPAVAQTQKLLTLDDVVANRFYAQRLRGLTPLSDGEHFSSLARGNKIEIYHYKTGKLVRTIEPQVPTGIVEYEFSADDQKILLATEVEQIYRHSYTAEYYIYTVATQKLMRLSENGKQQLATFSPDGSKVAFVRNNNLYGTDLTTREEFEISTDGKPNAIINGAPDWVYEEEFGFSKAFAWSPDSRTIAYYRFDERRVRQFEMQLFDGLYPSVSRYKYPKAGEDNSLVSILLYDLASKKTKPVDLGPETNQYIPRLKWTNSGANLCVARLNRLQNKLDLLLAQPDGSTRLLHSEERETYYDYEDLNNLEFLPDNRGYVITSERSGYRHLYHFDMEGKLVRPLTEGAFDLTGYYGFDPRTKNFYVQAAAVQPTQREVYEVPLAGGKMKRLTPDAGTNTATFSANFRYFVNTYSAANTPHITKLFSADGKEIRVLKDNPQLAATMAEYQYRPREFFRFTTSENIELHGFMIKPLGFDPSKKYPVLMYQYSGPGSQTVLDSYSGYIEWFQLLAQKGYLVVSVDGRGTGARGEAFRKVTYMKMGHYESTDQIETAKYLAAQPWVDAQRIGIFGWSYGGYMSTLCLLKGNEHFKSAIAVAPVTNWRYYDNIYTERYMRLPQDNGAGYDENSPIHFVNRLQGNYLLVHGTGDDNVHAANSMELIKKLIEHGKQFDLMLYPNDNHSIRSSRAVQRHLFERMTRFIEEKL